MMLLNEQTGQPIEITAEQAVSAGAFIGVLEDLPADVYHAAPYASNSFLNELERSPLHALTQRKEGGKDTPAKLMGTWVHCAILERDKFNQTFAVGPDVATRASKEWKEFAAKNDGKTLLKIDEYDQIMRMVEAVDKHPIASKLLTGGKSEVSMFWVDEVTGAKMKGRIDRLQPAKHIPSDLKTALDASFDAFQRSVQTYKYHRQSAIYLDGYNQLHGTSTTMFPHIVVEKEAPYAVAVYLLDDATIEKGRAEYRHLARIYAGCERTGTWNSYPEEIQTMNLMYF
jgi:hypothetical protein